MNGERVTRQALLDLREVDARKLRNWRLLTLAAALVGFWLGYLVR